MEILKVLEEGDVPSPGAKLRENEDSGQCEVCYSDGKPCTPSYQPFSTQEALKSWYLLLGPGHDDERLYLAIDENGRIWAEVTYAIAHEPSRNLSCEDCRDPHPKFFMVHDDLWVWNIGGPDILCLWCAQKRLGRPLTPADFKHCPVNAWIIEAFQRGGLPPQHVPLRPLKS